MKRFEKPASAPAARARARASTRAARPAAARRPAAGRHRHRQSRIEGAGKRRRPPTAPPARRCPRPTLPAAPPRPSATKMPDLGSSADRLRTVLARSRTPPPAPAPTARRTASPDTEEEDPCSTARPFPRRRRRLVREGRVRGGLRGRVFRAAAGSATRPIGEVLPSEHGKVSMATRWPLGVSASSARGTCPAS
jgi:hypothetical protein